MVVLNTHNPNDFSVTPPYDNCDAAKDSAKFKLFLFLEFGLKSLPPFLFYILGSVRYFTIKDYALGRARYSKFFLAKLIISVFMGIFDIVQALLIFTWPTDAPHMGWVKQCGLNLFGLFYIF
jgi:hypothetical protein